MLICPISGDVIFDYSVRVVSARLPHCIFFIVMNKYLMGRYFETMFLILLSTNFSFH